MITLNSFGCKDDGDEIRTSSSSTNSLFCFILMSIRLSRNGIISDVFIFKMFLKFKFEFKFLIILNIFFQFTCNSRLQLRIRVPPKAFD